MIIFTNICHHRPNQEAVILRLKGHYLLSFQNINKSSKTLMIRFVLPLLVMLFADKLFLFIFKV